MPSRRSKSVAINERISQAQKERTRLACRVCRARRIKCDGQTGKCGRCRLDKRDDCSYENVGSAERVAGRQRKRALRKQVTSDESVSTSTETAVSNKSDSNTTRDGTLDWSSPVLSAPQSFSTLSPHHPYPMPSTFAVNATNRRLSPVHLMPFKMEMEHDSATVQPKKSATMTPISSMSSSNLDDPTPSSYLTSLASSSSSTGNATGLNHLDSYPSTSWMSQSPIQQQQLQPPQLPTMNGMLPHINPSEYPSTHEVDYGSVDSLWRVYDWQYRCNNGLPPNFISQTSASSSAPL